MLEVHVSITGIAVLVIILILFLVGLLFYLYPGLSKATSLPGPVASDLRDGNLADIERAGCLHKYLNEIHAEYGDVVAFRYGPELVVSVSDPKLFAPRSQVFEIPGFQFDYWKQLVGEHSFLFSTGVDMFKRRDFLEYKLSTNVKSDYAKRFRKLSGELIKKWKSLPEGQHIPLSQHMRGLSMKAVCDMMFGDYFKDDASLFKLLKAWDLCWNEALASSTTEPVMDEKSIKKATTELQKIIQGAIEHQWQKKGKFKEDSLISGLLAASNTSLSEDQLLCDVITIFTIGVQVTTSVLTWSVYYLATHKDVQRHLRKKLQNVNSLDNMPHSLADIKYLRCILKESVRCSQMFTCAGRKQDIDNTFNEHVVPKNTEIIEAVSVAMKREDVWSEPCKFNPGRFADKDANLPDPLSYIPFAFGGSRRSPENSLVYLLASVALASIFCDTEIGMIGSDLQYAEANYEGLVVMPTKEELWISIGSPERGQVETVG